ncbi:MAG: hypothetical protein ACP5H3_00175 [Candidatus Aenigmatarchaeota archaeon]|jgi:hypothetical protein
MNFYQPRKVASIEENDEKICLIGKVEDIGNGFLVLSDETGKIKINNNFKIEKGSLIKVFCSKIDDELTVDFIQDMEGLDLELWKKTESLYLRLS